MSYNDTKIYTQPTDDLIAALPGIEALTPKEIEQIFLPDMPWKLYKVMSHDLTPTHANNNGELDLYYGLNEDGSPGPWHTIHENPVMCSHGIHITPDPKEWYTTAGWREEKQRVFEIEAKNIILIDANSGYHDPMNKLDTSTIRVLRELDLSDRDAYETAQATGRDFPDEDRKGWSEMMTLNNAYTNYRHANAEAKEAARAAQWAIDNAARIAEREAAAAKYEEDLRIAKEEADKARIIAILAAGKNGQIYVSKDADMGTVLRNAMQHLSCPHCDQRLSDSGFKQDVEISETRSYTNVRTIDGGGDWEEEDNDDCGYDNSDTNTDEQDLLYACCENRVSSSDFSDLFVFESKRQWPYVSDFQDMVQNVMRG